MRALVLAAVIVLTAPVAAEQSSRDPEIESLAFRTVSVSPELAADVLLRLAASPRVTDPSWKRELVDLAWERSFSAREPFRREAANAPPDSRAAADTLAFDTKLDRVNLQTRAVVQTLRLSAARAREMFEWIDFELKPQPCEEPLVPVLDEYYSTLAAVARTAFGESFIERADGLWFFQLYMWKASRPQEMLGITRATLQYKASPPDAQYLESVLQWIFEHSVQDARAFSASGIDLVARVAELDAYDVAQQVTGGTLLRAFRRYLVSQFSGPRCVDSQTEFTAADMFNRLASRRADGVADLKPIARSDTRPSRMLGPVRYDRMWQTGESQRLRSVAAALYGNGRQAHTEAYKAGREWQDAARRFVEDLERWNGAHEPNDRDYYYEKSALLTGLLEIAPAGAIKSRALGDLVAFLKRTSGRQAPAAWYAHVKRLVDLATGREREAILDAMEQSDDPALAIYARLDRMRVEDARRRATN